LLSQPGIISPTTNISVEPREAISTVSGQNCSPSMAKDPSSAKSSPRKSPRKIKAPELLVLNEKVTDDYSSCSSGNSDEESDGESRNSGNDLGDAEELLTEVEDLREKLKTGN